MANEAQPIVLITGVAGAVGVAVVDALKADHGPVGMDRETDGPIPIIRADFTHGLGETLPKVVAALKADPAGWYKANKIGCVPPGEKQ